MSAFIYARRTFSSERENMELLDLRFSEKTLKILKGMAGQVFEKYRCDPSIFHPVYLLPVGIYAGGKCYIITQKITGRAAGGKKTDVLEWIFREAEEKEIHSSRPDVVQEDHALQKEIKEVRIINEKKTLSRCDKAEYRVYLTKAVRFIFERDTCRSENLFISPLSLIWKMMGKNAGNGKNWTIFLKNGKKHMM